MIPKEHIEQFDRAYFIGVGGIGMSALARYFNSLGWPVAGYDKTPSPLTAKLEEEGIEIHYEDFGPSIPQGFRDTTKTLVIYTPAVPRNFGELLHVQHSGFVVKKRAEVLGMITRNSKGLAVAGTHGKTTTSTMMAHLLDVSEEKCNAFLGGISSNFQSNFVQGDSNWTVVEADEFDRSFLHLNPLASIVTSTDADHLDIYGNSDTFLEGFRKYVDQIHTDGLLVRHVDVNLQHKNTLTYGLNHEADYSGWNPRVENEFFTVDVKTPNSEWKSVQLGLPGVHNAENAIACIALAEFVGLDEKTIRKGLKTFKGVKRRFEYHIREENLIYIDDYAHHPTEIKALIDSVELLYAGKRITGIFQPHLFTRTRDFFDGFAEQLSRLDEVILMPIYPAREEPISGVTSDALLEKITSPEKRLLEPSKIIADFELVEKGARTIIEDSRTSNPPALSSSKMSRRKGEKRELERESEGIVILTIGAGDIDRIVEPLKNTLLS
ncbi:MAG: UDP-N-acetylmuramate--L-alanine ligase [bacterium]|nr:UDP-N-acetylmuramate--L-alanine ligase [bacterium]